jgi:hypothetical protein
MKQLTDTERSALASAYVAFVHSACVSSNRVEAGRALEGAIRVASKLGVPAEEVVQYGQHEATAVIRFAEWLEKDAAERARKAQVLR